MKVQVDIRRKLGDFSMDIRFASDSRRIGILGASGCGKSMMLKSIAGIELPDDGRIEISGRVFFDRAAKVNLKPQKRRVGYLFQNYALFPTMTVSQNIAAGVRGNRAEKDRRVSEMIRKFRLQGLEEHLPGQLSGGQQQRAALARIMAYEPEVILLDEPFSALDMHLKDQLERELAEMLWDYPGIVFLVSHNRDEVYRFCEELAVIDQGKTAVFGKTKDIFSDPVSKEAARLTGCKNVSRLKKIDAHHGRVPGWGVEIRTKNAIPEYAEWIGYRAHDFVPLWGKKPGENRLRSDIVGQAELPFERNYYIRGGKEDETVCWFVQRENIALLEERGLPDYLELKEEKMLFLK